MDETWFKAAISAEPKEPTTERGTKRKTDIIHGEYKAESVAATTKKLKADGAVQSTLPKEIDSYEKSTNRVVGENASGSEKSKVSCDHDNVERNPSRILTISDVNGPSGIAVNSKGEIFVVEHYSSCVSVFSSSGEKLRSFGTYGSTKRQFNYPCGLTMDNEGHIFVADKGNKRVQKFTQKGDFITAVDCNSPADIIFNAANGRVYVGNDDNSVQILTSDLGRLCNFGKNGHEKGQFSGILHMACDNDGNVFVTDDDNNYVHVFTAEGEFVRAFGDYGEGRGQIKSPMGIAIDQRRNRVYVSEYDNPCISVFTCEGQFLMSFNSEEELGCPANLLVDNGLIYVCDTLFSYMPSGQSYVHVFAL